MYKVIIDGSNDSVAQSISLQQADHSYETRQRSNIIPPFPRVEAIRRSYKTQFIKIWNEIPDDIKNSCSLKVFKRKFSEHQLQSY